MRPISPWSGIRNDALRSVGFELLCGLSLFEVYGDFFLLGHGMYCEHQNKKLRGSIS